MIEKIKKNWKNILLVIVAFFALNKCTQSCNRQTTIDKQSTQIETLDSIITALKADTLAKAHRIDVLCEQINTANEKVNVASANAATAKANEETAKANADKARAEKAKAEAERRAALQNNK